jgi:hypothetical protein
VVETPYTQGFRNGRAYEQERLIKLLEKHLGEVDWDDLIAIIKGKS